MAESRACILCDSEDLRRHKGAVAPFLSQRIWGKRPFPATLLECKECGFLYFEPRLTAEEEQRLYRSYREDEYQHMRHATEPWYTEKLNASLFSDEAMHARREEVGRALRSHLPANGIQSVLDFGGARGELVQHLIPGARGFVYDISQIEPLPNITRVELDSGQTFDLVVCSNVFEHVASPRLLLEQIVSLCHAGTFLFVEVPHESPLEFRTRLKRVAQLVILAVTHMSLAARLVSLGSMNVMHEHLNFYSPKSLRRLMETVPNFSPVAQGAYGDTIWALAQLGGTSAS